MARVGVVAPDGTIGTVEETDVGAMPEGSRVLSPEEQKTHDLEAAYDKTSTAQTVGGGAARLAAGPIVGNALSASGVTSQMPAVESFNRGLNEPATLGFDEALTRQAVEGAGGSGAAKQYAQHLADVKEAFPTANTAGEVAGFAALMAGGRAGGGAANLIPGIGMSAGGEALEQGVGRGLASFAEGGIGQKALATGAKIGARGAFEGAVFSGGNELSSQITDDQYNGERLYTAIGHGALAGGATGFGLGAAGSLASSGAKAIGRYGIDALLSRFARASDVGDDVAADASRVEQGPVRTVNRETELQPGGRLLGEGDRTATPRFSISGEGVTEGAPAAKAKPLVEEMLGDVVPKNSKVATPAATPAETMATNAEARTRRVANDLAFDSLGTTRKIADKINDLVEGGTNAVGDWVNRNIGKNGDRSFWEMLGQSRADEIQPLIEAKVAEIGRKIGDEVAAFPMRVGVDEVMAPANRIRDAMLKDPTQIQGAAAFEKRILQMGEAFSNAKKVDGNLTMSLSDLYYARASMEGVAHELESGSAAHKAFKTYLRELDDMLVTKLEDAATASGRDSTTIRSLKREYQLGSWAQSAVDDGTKRIKGNNIFGLREGVGAAVGLATGHIPGAILGAVAGKAARERGAAIGAHILSQAADQGVVARAVKFANERVEAAAKGVLNGGEGKAKTKLSGSPRITEKSRRKDEPTTRAEVKAQQRETITQGQAIMRWVADTKANPDAALEEIQRSAELVSQNAGPKTAEGYTTSALRAMNFITSYVPVKEQTDPLDPRTVPSLTYDEASRLVRATTYALNPPSVWDDFGKGKVTQEGIAAANAFMGDQFSMFQDKLQDVVTDELLHNKRLTQSQRLRVDKLLGQGDMSPRKLTSLQANFLPLPPDPTQGPSNGNNAPVDMKISQAGFDSVEARQSS